MSDTATPLAPPPIYPGQIRHSVKTMALARHLYAGGEGWTPTQIRRLLEERGVDPLPNVRTIRNWVVPGEADRWKNSRSSSATAVVPADAYARLQRLRQLREAGMSYSGCAVVAAVDFGLELSADQARYVIKARRLTPIVRRHLEGSAA